MVTDLANLENQGKPKLEASSKVMARSSLIYITETPKNSKTGSARYFGLGRGRLKVRYEN